MQVACTRTYSGQGARKKIRQRPSRIQLRHVRASTTTCARLYIHQYICTYTFTTRMTMLRTFRPGGSRLSGTSLRAKMQLVGPNSQGGGESFCFFARTHFLACEGLAGGSQQSGGNIFFAKYGCSSDWSQLSGGGIIFLHVIRRHFLAVAVDPAVSLSTYSPRSMEVVPCPR